MAKRIPLERVLPSGVACPTWGGGCWYVYGVENAREACRATTLETEGGSYASFAVDYRAEPCFLVAWDECPRYHGDDEFLCCEGECEGCPVFIETKAHGVLAWKVRRRVMELDRG